MRFARRHELGWLVRPRMIPRSTANAEAGKCGHGYARATASHCARERPKMALRLASLAHPSTSLGMTLSPVERVRAFSLYWLAMSEPGGSPGETPGEANGAGNGIRTRDFDLGKVALYH